MGGRGLRLWPEVEVLVSLWKDEMGKGGCTPLYLFAQGDFSRGSPVLVVAAAIVGVGGGVYRGDYQMGRSSMVLIVDGIYSKLFGPGLCEVNGYVRSWELEELMEDGEARLFHHLVAV